MAADAQLTPDLMLQAYAAGIFPMAEAREDPAIFWVDPRLRGVMPLDGFHLSRSLARRLRQEPFRITIDQAFAAVIDGCADRSETWINQTLLEAYHALHRRGRAHSLEVWDGATLVGGVYGITLGSAFFGESMFSRRRDASKIALAYLVDHLRSRGFRLFDTQFLTPHLASLGALEIPRAAYHELLEEALAHPAEFTSPGDWPSGQELAQRMTQRS